MTLPDLPSERSRRRVSGPGVSAGILDIIAILQFGYTISTQDHRAIIAGSLIGLGILGASSLAFARWWNVAITLGVAVVLVGAGALVYVNPSIVEPQVRVSPSPYPVLVTPTPAAPVDVRLVQPEGPIPFCNDFTLVGTIPSGISVLLFDRASGSGQSYYFDGVAEPTASGWIVRNVQIGDGGPGDRGVKVQLVIVLVDEAVGTYLDAIVSGDEGWWSPILPGPAQQSVSVVRDGDSRQCP